MKTLKEDLNDKLYILFRDVGLVRTWWTNANSHFNGKSPIEVFNSDKQIEVIKYINNQFI